MALESQTDSKLSRGPVLDVDLEDLVPAFLLTLQPQHAILDFHGGLVPIALSEAQVVFCQDDDVELPELRAFL